MKLNLVTEIREDGGFIVPSFYKEQYKKFYDLSKKRYGGYAMVLIGTPERSKTTKQNNKFHALNQEIAFLMGWEAEDCKNYIKELAVETFGYPPQVKEDGSIAFDPWGKIKGLSVALATTEDLAKLIEAAYFLAARESLPLSELDYEEKFGV